MSMHKRLPSTIDEAIEQTQDFFCYGEEREDLEVRMRFVQTLPEGSVAMEFGIGEGRYPIVIGMVNPKIHIVTFDIGRRDISDDDLITRTLDRAQGCGVTDITCLIANSVTSWIPWMKLNYLGIDSDGSYEITKKEIEKFFPRVLPGGRIFMQSYNLTNKYPGIKQAVDEYLLQNKRYALGEQYHNTREIYVQS